jgi:methyl-accepting chemotaxis protein
MSDTKKQVSEVVETIKKISEAAGEAGRKAAGFDKELSTKIHRIRQASEEASKHIEERKER